MFSLNESDDFYNFFKNDFKFFVNNYIKILDAKNKYHLDLPHIHYINYWGIADSLQDALLLSSINYEDDTNTINKKLDFVARFIETFTVRRAINYKKFGQTTIKYTMFNIIKLIRNNDLVLLGQNLTKETDTIEQEWDGIDNFGLHGQNKKFVKHLLSRISSYLDVAVGKQNNYVSYHNPDGKQFEIEHIWGNKFNEHRDEFEQEWDFKEWRNSIGALILLPNGTNQSFTSDKYEAKIKHYLKENTYAQTLHPDYYEKNPNFLKSEQIKQLNFKPHSEFKKKDIEKRIEVVKKICKQLWSIDYYIIKEK